MTDPKDEIDAITNLEQESAATHHVGQTVAPGGKAKSSAA